MNSPETLSITELDTILAEASSQAAFYREAQKDGPILGLGNAKPVSDQLRPFASFLVPGDCLVKLLQSLPPTPKVSAAVTTLATTMLGFAGRGVMYARPDRIVSEVEGINVIKNMTGFDVQSPAPLSELVIDKLLGQQSTNRYMYEPIAGVVNALAEAGETANIVHFARKVTTVADDNDLACVVGNLQHDYMKRFQGGDQTAGTLAYELLRLDNAIMGSTLDVSIDDYLGRSPQETAAPEPAHAKKAERRLDGEGMALDGLPIRPGDRFVTLSEKLTTPYPRQKSQKYASRWLIENAVTEAEGAGNMFAAKMFAATLLLRDGSLTMADRDAMLGYLFGNDMRCHSNPSGVDLFTPESTDRRNKSAHAGIRR